MLRHLKLNKLISFHINDEKLLEKYKPVWTKIEDLKSIKLNVLPANDDRYIKTKIKTYNDKFCSNFRVLIVPEHDIECQSFAVISIGFLLLYDKKYCLRVYVGNCAYKIVDKQVTD